MKIEYINPFYIATQEVFNMMLDLSVERGSLKVVENVIASQEASVVLGLTGQLQGSVLLSFPKQMALEMVQIMAGIKLDEIDPFVSSAIGEVANIIGGNAATKLAESQYKCDITPPQVFIGKYQTFSMATDKGLYLPLNTAIGTLDLNIAIAPKNNGGTL